MALCGALQQRSFIPAKKEKLVLVLETRYTFTRHTLIPQLYVSLSPNRPIDFSR
jgi:hypothetical protein